MIAGQLTLADAQARGAHNADPEWLDAARRIVTDLAATGQGFTIDDVRDRLARLDVTTPDGRALGGVITTAARAGRIVNTGRTEKARHRRGCRNPIWQRPHTTPETAAMADGVVPLAPHPDPPLGGVHNPRNNQ